MQKKKKEKKKGEKENKQNKKRMDMVNTEKRKEKQEVQLLNYQQIPPLCQKSMKSTERKVKALSAFTFLSVVFNDFWQSRGICVCR